MIILDTTIPLSFTEAFRFTFPLESSTGTLSSCFYTQEAYKLEID